MAVFTAQPVLFCSFLDKILGCRLENMCFFIRPLCLNRAAPIKRLMLRYWLEHEGRERRQVLAVSPVNSKRWGLGPSLSSFLCWRKTCGACARRVWGVAADHGKDLCVTHGMWNRKPTKNQRTSQFSIKNLSGRFGTTEQVCFGGFLAMSKYTWSMGG